MTRENKLVADDAESLTNDKKTLEETIVDLSTSGKLSDDDRTTLETDVKQNEERAKVSQIHDSLEI